MKDRARTIVVEMAYTAKVLGKRLSIRFTVRVDTSILGRLQSVAYHAHDFRNRVPIQLFVLCAAAKSRKLASLVTTEATCVETARLWMSKLCSSSIMWTTQYCACSSIMESWGQLCSRKQRHRIITERNTSATILPYQVYSRICLLVVSRRWEPPSWPLLWITVGGTVGRNLLLLLCEKWKCLAGLRRGIHTNHRGAIWCVSSFLFLLIALPNRISQSLNCRILLLWIQGRVGCNGPNQLLQLGLACYLNWALLGYYRTVPNRHRRRY
mmetsp:Transcript_20210/g.55795  ORF Transcript_20210/g.55795 Transcript_20210/m.55795 type:complete len:268 (-) Transcript_20210:1678-2481(-)